MSLNNEAETAFLTLLFNNVAWANIGDGSGLQPSGIDGNFYLSLHTADPGESGDQESNECTYTSYARIAKPRTAGNWTVSGNNVSNAVKIVFPKSTGGDETALYFGIGTDSSGAGHLVASGKLSTPFAISDTNTPEFDIGECNTNVN